VNRDNEAFDAEFEQTPTIVLNDQEDPLESQIQTEARHQEELMSPKSAQVNVFDYEVSNFDDEKKPGQEMQERGGASLLGNGTSNEAAVAETSKVGSQGSHEGEHTDAMEQAK
jgi:hypothetical protein